MMAGAAGPAAGPGCIAELEIIVVRHRRRKEPGEGGRYVRLMACHVAAAGAAGRTAAVRGRFGSPAGRRNPPAAAAAAVRKGLAHNHQALRRSPGRARNRAPAHSPGRNRDPRRTDGPGCNPVPGRPGGQSRTRAAGRSGSGAGAPCRTRPGTPARPERGRGRVYRLRPRSGAGPGSGRVNGLRPRRAGRRVDRLRPGPGAAALWHRPVSGLRPGPAGWPGSGSRSRLRPRPVERLRAAPVGRLRPCPVSRLGTRLMGRPRASPVGRLPAAPIDGLRARPVRWAGPGPVSRLGPGRVTAIRPLTRPVAQMGRRGALVPGRPVVTGLVPRQPARLCRSSGGQPRAGWVRQRGDGPRGLGHGGVRGGEGSSRSRISALQGGHGPGRPAQGHRAAHLPHKAERRSAHRHGLRRA